MTAPRDDVSSEPAVPASPGLLNASLALALLCLMGIAAAAATGAPWPVMGALGCAALAAAAVQLVRLSPAEPVRIAALYVIAGLATGAAVLGGGPGGPLGALCAAPLAVALGLDRRRLASAGAALSVCVTALAAGARLAGLTPTPPAPFDLWLGTASVSVIVLCVSAASLASLRRRQARADLAEARAARLEALLADQPCLLLVLEEDGRPAGAYGAPPPGIDVEQLFAEGLIAACGHPHRPGLMTALRRAGETGRASAEFAPRRALDHMVAIDLNRREDGRLVGALRDVTVEKARETDLLRQKSEAEQLNVGKSRFLANMSHELRTPLNAVIGFSDIMRQRLFGPLPDRYAEYAQLIHESGGHLLDLINDVLDMSKIEAERYELKLESFDARDPIAAALRLVRLQAHEAEIGLRGVLPADPVPVQADRRALKQMALNLLSNALKFTPKGGAVSVSLAAVGRFLELTVTDTGIGVAPEDLKRLGRPYEQAGDQSLRSRGTGLGLSLVRAFAELHGGAMAIESVLGEGTAVTVRMPVIEAEPARPPETAKIIPLNGPRSA